MSLMNCHCSTLLQILAKRIMVDIDGEILEHQLNSPFVYLRTLSQGYPLPAMER
jgi:hypothetical protein